MKSLNQAVIQCVKSEIEQWGGNGTDCVEVSKEGKNVEIEMEG